MIKVSPINLISDGVSAGTHFDLCFSGFAARTCSAYVLVDSTTRPTNSRVKKIKEKSRGVFTFVRST